MEQKFKFESFRVENNVKWFKNKIKKERAFYMKEIKSGKTDPGYVWPFMKLSAFFEGVFTMNPTPMELTLEIPAGQIHLTVTDGKHWVVRNDMNNSLAVYDVESFFKWAVEVYPEGIGAEGYEQLTLHILTQGCNEAESAEIYDKTFFVEAA